VPLITVGAIDMPDGALGGWIYLIVLGLVLAETTVMLGFVIHGELVLMLAGVAAARGDASVALLIALAWAAAVGGDVIGVLLGRRLGGRLAARHRERAESFLARHGGKALFLGRFNGFTRAVMPFVVGSSALPLRRLLPFSIASGLVWTSTFTLIGSTVAESFTTAGRTAQQIGAGSIVLAAAGFGLYALVKRARARAALRLLG
jgi:membrane protein DedA with SNARE-associated domain